MELKAYINESLHSGRDGKVYESLQDVIADAPERLKVLADKKLRIGVGTDRLCYLFKDLGFKWETSTIVEKNPTTTEVFGKGSIGSNMSKFVVRFKDGSTTIVRFSNGHLMDMQNFASDGKEDDRYPSIGQVKDGKDWREKIIDTLCRKIKDLC